MQEKERLAARMKAAAEAAKQRELDATEADALKARIKSSDDDKRIAIHEDDFERLQRTDHNPPMARRALLLALPRLAAFQSSSMPLADEIVPKARISQSLLQDYAELVDVPDPSAQKNQQALDDRPQEFRRMPAR